MSSKIIKLNSSSGLLWVIKAGIFACLFMPLIINGDFIFPYIFPKQAFFQIVVEIVLALYLFLAFRNPDFRPRSSWLFKAFGFYFVIMILSSLFGVNTYHSFWSDYERMAGTISLLHYLGFLFVAVNIFKNQKEWNTFFDVSILASVLEAIFSFGQLLGIFVSDGGRLEGTIGNASFLAGYMLINTLFAFWLMIEKKDVAWRFFYAFAVIFDLTILYQTETRGAMVGLFFGLLVLFIFFIFARRQDLAQLPFNQVERIRKYVIGLALIFLMAVGMIWLARDSNFIKSIPTLSRVTHISITEVTAQTRLLAWKMSLKGFLERPIFGWGPENYYVVFNKYYDPHLYPVESWFDRSHNAFLDILVNTGIFGFLAYSAIFILAFRYLWSAWRKEKIKYHTAVIFSVILIAYAIQNIFVFDTQVTLLMIFSIMAFIVWLSFSAAPSQPAKIIKPNAFLILLVVFATGFFLYFVNIKPGLASTNAIKALTLLRNNRVEESLVSFKNALEIGTFGLPEVALRVQDIAANLVKNPQSPAEIKNKFVVLTIDSMNKALEMEPLNARFMMMLANIYISSAASDNSYLAQADALLQKALELSPTRQELYFYIGQVRMFQGRTDEALALFKRAVDLNDTVGLSHWNYGIIAIVNGQKELGESEIKIAKDSGYSFGASSIKQLINAYARTNDLAHITVLYKEWISLSPNSAEPYAGLAAVYAQMGEKQKAKETALQAVALDQTYQAEAEQFIKNLGL